MVKAQIQLPDDMHIQLKLLAARLETSMAEILRRGAEYMLRVHPEVSATSDWQLPEPLELGVATVGVERWRELANEIRPNDALESRSGNG